MILRFATVAAALLQTLALTAAPARAQLRPPEPAEWSTIRGDRWLVLRAGVGVFSGQRASLAGVRGRLVEAGDIRVEWRSGRATVEAGGTVVRLLDGYESYEDPVASTRLADGAPLRDSGAWRIGTAIRLTAADRPVVAALRFGTRLPNTDDRKGLDRDMTDFYAMVGVQARPPALRGAALATEVGLGIHGSRTPGIDQADALLYTVSAELPYGAASLRAMVTGQHTPGRAGRARGNENLSEARAGIVLGRRHALHIDGVVGMTRYSPRAGIIVGASMRR